MTLVKGDSTKALAHADRSHTTSGSNISHKEKSRGSLKSAGDHHPNTISKSRATSSGHLDKSKKQKARPKSGFDRSSTPHAKDVKQKHASQPNLSSRGSSHPQTSETKSPSIPPVPTNVGLNRSASDGLVDSVFLTGQEVARQNGDARQGLTEGEPDAVRQTDEKPAGYPRSALKGTRRPSSQPNMRHRSVSLATGLDERGGVASAIVELHQPSNTDEDKPQPGLQHRSQSQRARAKSAVTHRRKSLQDVENSTPTQNLDHSERNVKDSVPLPLTTASNPTIHEASSESSGLSSKKVSVLSLKYSMAELRMELADAETDLSDFQKSIQKIVDPSSAAREGVVKSDLQVNRKTADTRAFSGNSGNDNSQNKLGLYRRYVQSATSLSTHDENMVTVDRAKLRRTKSAVTSISTGARHEHAELVKITAKPTPFAKSNATVTEKSPTTPQLTNSMTQSSGNIGSSPVSPLKDNSTVSLPQVGSLRALTMDKPSDESSTKDNATVVEAAQDVKPTSEVEGVAFQTINALIHPVSEDSPQKGSTEIPPPSVLPQHHVPLTGDEHIQYLIDQLKKQNQHLSSLPISQPSRPPHVGDHDPVAASRTKPHHPDFSVVPLNAQYDVVFATRPRSSSLLKYRERRVITMRALRRLVWAHEMVGERLEGDERVNEKSKTGSLISSRVQSSRSGNSGGTDEKQNEQQEQQQKIQKVDDAKLATELPPPDALKQLQPAVPEPQEPSRATTPPNESRYPHCFKRRFKRDIENHIEGAAGYQASDAATTNASPFTSSPSSSPSQTRSR
ncbi:hypothetical protein HK102_010670 [Quaeritorhiza haematococci]|nr:hypothetical protein HK102_010670 [Quaeritorhiza haematococci]